MLDIGTAAGRLIKQECRHHLTNPAHAILSSGNKDPVALRIRKVTIILSSLAFLSDMGMGERWFGRTSSLNRKSAHVWPDDSTTLTLLFAKLLYRIQRNMDIKQRRKPDEICFRKHGAIANGSAALPSPAVSVSGFAHDSPSVSLPDQWSACFPSVKCLAC